MSDLHLEPGLELSSWVVPWVVHRIASQRGGGQVEVMGQHADELYTL